MFVSQEHMGREEAKALSPKQCAVIELALDTIKVQPKTTVFLLNLSYSHTNIHTYTHTNTHTQTHFDLINYDFLKYTSYCIMNRVVILGLPLKSVKVLALG